MFLGKKNSNASPEEIEVRCRKSVLIQIVIFSEKRNIRKNFSLLWISLYLYSAMN